jgi:ElaB/YqjD/DUF883 family membrane-anchored ribosome-binding protein
MSSADTFATSARDATRKGEDAMDNLRAKGGEVAEHAQDVVDTLKGALDDAIRTRPYTTLLAAGAVGFLCAVLRHR